MRLSFKSQVKILKEFANRFDTESSETKLNCIKHLSKTNLPFNKDLITYFETLLFITAYPSDAHQLLIAEKELMRITRLLKSIRNKKSKLFENTGMPFMPTITRFSHDAIRWLMKHPFCTITFHSFENPTLLLNDVLRFTLPTLEKSETTAGRNNEELMDSLMVPKKQQLQFLINELTKLDHLPFIKDHFHESLELFVHVNPLDKSFSKAYNRLSVPAIYFNHELLKNFDTREILDSPLPPSIGLNEQKRRIVSEVIKNSMIITARETDPTTYMDESSLRLFHLDRGFSIAICTMIPSRQLPLESYIGYTAFKNGFPAAYGGSWVFGERGNFGINIFESFRSGESGYIMAQLLRVYKQIFNIHYFEVEPFQFGLDNPEGIKSGAFWFYYRFGFRPLDKKLRELAKKEHDKIVTKQRYRTSHRTLIRFTESNIGLKLGRYIPPKLSDITFRVTRMMQSKYQGNRLLAETECRNKFLEKTGLNAQLTEDENQVLTEVALWSECINISDPRKLRLMVEMIKTKPVDVYAYQTILINFFREEK